MPKRLALALLLLLLAVACSTALNQTNATSSSAAAANATFAQFLSCCPNYTQPVVACLGANFSTSAFYASSSTFSSIARSELDSCAVSLINQSNYQSINQSGYQPANQSNYQSVNQSNYQSSNQTSNSSLCAPKKDLDCYNSSLMNDICVPVNRSGTYWTCSERPLVEVFNLSKCIEAFQQNNGSAQKAPSSGGDLQGLSAFFSNSFSQVAGLEDTGTNALNASWISFLLASVALTLCARSRIVEVKAERRVLRILTAVNIVAMVAYLVMSAGEGRVKSYKIQMEQTSTTFSMILVPEPMKHQWYARHVLWIITTPGLLYALWFMGGNMVEYFVLSVAMSEMMLFCGLIATLLNESQAAKWLLLFYGIFFFVMIIYMIIRRFNTQDPRKAPRKQSSTHMRSTFTLAANYTIIVWLMYPIFWILSDGLDQINDNKSVIAFSVLDMASKIGFSAIFFRACKKTPNWLKSIVTFNRAAKAPSNATSATLQQQTAIAPIPATVDNGSGLAADPATLVEMQSPGPHVRKAKGARDRTGSERLGQSNARIPPFGSPVVTVPPSVASPDSAMV